jgi:hypothetical protein
VRRADEVVVLYGGRCVGLTKLSFYMEAGA